MRARAALASFVRRSGDRRLERTVASGPALAVLLRAGAARFDPAAAQGFSGDLQLDLRSAAGGVRAWTIAISGRRARVRRGTAAEPAVVIRLARADLARLAAGELDVGRALLAGRLDVEGDLETAMRIGPMFGGPSLL
ncbi:MAG TPA: SCP2 sterol-binding domain-containing protein [Solirubrobacteraceae bacterium]|nr:SCP2 sterol-binding domain-containing protein [Solirubrobacteraceae bacterium]